LDKQVDAEIMDRFAALAASDIYEANGKSGDMSPEIRPIADDARVVGPAYTVRCWPGDLGAMRRAVDQAPAGSVLVIDGGGTNRSTVWGGGATIVARRRGIRGLVTNGATRDVEQIRGLGFPVFCAGITVRGGTRNHQGWVGEAVSVGDVCVNPGDLVVGDPDGVVVVPKDRIETVLAAAIEYDRKTRIREEELRAGASYLE
jgi:4-hydroxy-4-methyl-2-oxoglutarate aldolase